jgi:hypothetical protein
MDSGVARRPIADFEAYEESLNRFVFRSGFVMKPVFAAAGRAQARHLRRGRGRARAARHQVVLEDGIAIPILIGRPGHREPHQALRPVDRGRARLRDRQPRGRSALPRLCRFSALSLMITNKGAYFLADTHVRQNPSAEEIAEMTIACASHVERFGIKPKIALVSHSDFGSVDSASALKMRNALQLLLERAPGLEVDGEMQADTALSQVIRDKVLPGSRFEGEANVLIMPNLDAANIAYQLTKALADALPVGPILIGPARPAHVVTPSVTARGIVNITAVAVVEAQAGA